MVSGSPGNGGTVQFDKDQIVQLVTQKNISSTCPRCGKATSWELVDGFVHFDVSADTEARQIGERAFPAVALACNQCGYLTFHATGPLGL